MRRASFLCPVLTVNPEFIMSRHLSSHTRAGVTALLVGLLTWLSVFGLLGMSSNQDSPFISEVRAKFPSAPSQSQLSANLKRFPLSFEENRGQTHNDVKFISRTLGYTFYLTSSGAIFETAGSEADKVSALEMRLLGASPNSAFESDDPLWGKSNYFIGNDPGKWITDASTFASVRQRNVYEGVDIIYYGNQQQLEYDFVVAPNADPRQINLSFNGARRIATDENGDLVIGLADLQQSDRRQLRMHKPVVYQEVNGKRRYIEAGYSIRNQQFDGNQSTVSFKLGDYDSHLPLVIDPLVDYSTYYGGSGTDIGYGIAVDKDGYVYVTGQTSSLNFPLKNAFQTTRDGATDAFVMKLSQNGLSVIFSTYIGGRNPGDKGASIVVDQTGNIYLTGETNSLNFPTVNAAQPIFRGNTDAFITKFNPAGNELIYSTYLGGTLPDAAYGIAIDSSNSVYITGRTQSSNFPTKNPMQATLKGQQDVFVAKFASDGALTYSTYLGGEPMETGARDEESGYSIAIDQLKNVYITGFTTTPTFPTLNAIQSDFGGVEDVFVTKINSNGSALVYSTFLGGDRAEEARAIAVDALGNAYITGYTFSQNFPAFNALQPDYGGNVDAFVTKINAAGTELIYSTFLGGNGGENTGLVADITPVGGIAVDNLGNAYLTGKTESNNFPVVRAIQPSLRGDNDAFVAKINPSGTELIYSTYLGSTFTGNNGFDERGLDLAIDRFGSVYVTGQILKNDFLTLLPVQQNYGGGLSDAFITKISSPDIVTIAPVSAASFVGPSLAPSEIVAAFGIGLANGIEAAASTPLPTSLLGTSVTIKDKNNSEFPAPLFFVSPLQVNFQIPDGIATGQAMIIVNNSMNNFSVGASVLIEKTAPGLFTANANGLGVPAAVLLRVKSEGDQIFEPVAQLDNQNNFVPRPINFGPDMGDASDQLFLILFGTGWRGRSAESKVLAQIGGVNAPVLYAGAQGTFVGEDQINLQLPRSLAGSGTVDLSVIVDGQMANLVRVAFQ